MTRYFFDVRHVAGRVRDIEGVELPDIKAVRAEVATEAREMITEMALKGIPIDNGAFEICDETRAASLTLPFRRLLDKDRGTVKPT